MPKTKKKPNPKSYAEHGKTAQTPRIAKLGSTIQTDYLSSYYAKSFEFPYNPDSLVSGNNYNIYDEMRDDAQLKATLTIKKNMIIGNGWRIVSDEKEGEKGKEICEEVTKILNKISQSQPLGNTFEDILKEILSSYDYGFSLSEVIYKLSEDNLYMINNVVTRPPHTFQFHLNPAGMVIEVEQSAHEGQLHLDPGIFFHHVYQPEFGNPFGVSDLRAAFEPWTAKKYVSRWLGIYLEKYATPFVVMKYPSNFQPEEIARLNDIAKTIKSSTSMTLPEDILIEIKSAMGNGSDAYLRALEYWNLQMARSILVPDLLGFGGSETKSGGSQALGREQFKAFLSITQTDGQSLAAKWTNKVIRPLILANWGDFNCWFEFAPPSSDNIALYADTWAKAVGAKTWKPNDDEINHFRASMGFPEGDVERPEKPEVPDGQIPNDKKPKNQPETPLEGNKKKDEFKDHISPGRPLTSYERKIDFREIERVLDKAQKQMKRELTAVGNDMIQSILSQIRLNPKEIKDLKPAHQKTMNRVFKSNFRSLFTDSIASAEREIMAKPKGFTDATLPQDYIDILEAESFKMVGDYTVHITKPAQSLLADGLKNGASLSEITRLVSDEIKAKSDTWISTVVQTKTTEIYNEARKRYWETDPIASQIVVAYQWSAILDTRTSPICDNVTGLDGKIWRVGDYANIVKPPAHFNCRSILVPITKFEDFERSKNFLSNPEEQFPSAKINKLGGNLIKTKKFADHILTKTIDIQGDYVLVAPADDESIIIESLIISNLSRSNDVQVWIHDEANEILITTIIRPSATHERKDIKFPKGQAVILTIQKSVRLNYELHYKIVK